MKLYTKFAMMMVVLLAACSSVNIDHPEEMIGQAMKRQFTHDNQYNFSGDISLKIHNFENKAQINDDDEKSKELNITDNMITYFLSGLSVPSSGAVDLPAGKIEIIPQIQFKQHNVLSNVKVPLFLDLKQEKLYADIGALQPVLYYVKPFKNISVTEKEISLSMPSNLRNKIPLKTIFKALPDAVYEAYTSIPKDKYRVLEMNDDARAFGAVHRIGLDWNMKETTEFSNKIMDLIGEYLQKAGGEDNINEEDYLNFVQMWLESTPSGLDFLQTEMNDDDAKEWENLPINTEFYLDKQGRLKGYLYTMSFKNLSFWERLKQQNKYLEISSKFGIDYTKPLFTMKAGADAIDITCLFEDEQSCPWDVDKNIETDANDAEEAVAETAQVQKHTDFVTHNKLIDKIK